MTEFQKVKRTTKRKELIMSKYKEQVRAYKITNPKDGFWAIIAADSDYSARNMFVKEYYYPNNVIDSLMSQKLDGKESVKTPFFNDKTTIKYVLNTIKYFPRVISDQED